MLLFNKYTIMSVTRTPSQGLPPPPTLPESDTTDNASKQGRGRPPKKHNKKTGLTGGSYTGDSDNESLGGSMSGYENPSDLDDLVRRIKAIDLNTKRLVTVNEELQNNAVLNSREIARVSNEVQKNSRKFELQHKEFDRMSKAQNELKNEFTVQKEQTNSIEAAYNGIKTNINNIQDKTIQLIDRRSQQQNGRVFPNLKLEKPSFSAALFDRPKTYLKQLRDYLRETHVLDEEIKIVIGQTLSGPASDWWEHVAESVTNYESFRLKFEEKYWNPTIQDKVISELQNGYYKADLNLTRSEYVIRLNNKIKQISTPIEERRVVEYFSYHFDTIVNQAIIVQKVNNINELCNLLDSLDFERKLNSPYEQNGSGRNPKVVERFVPLRGAGRSNYYGQSGQSNGNGPNSQPRENRGNESIPNNSQNMNNRRDRPYNEN